MRVDDSAYTEGRGCYTSARVQGGRVRFGERHVTRLVHGAHELGIGELEREKVMRAFAELAEAAFGAGEGVIRLQASRDSAGHLHLVGVPRSIGSEPDEWSAIVVGVRHVAEVGDTGLKVTCRLALALAADAARDAGVDEALLLDDAGRLVEGTRSNIVVVLPSGPPATPTRASGAVAGVALAVARERLPELVERPVPESELRGAGEILALNAVRGARPITQLDGSPVGDGRPGPWAARFAAALAED